MRKIYYYLLSIPFLVMLFSTNAQAATSYVSGTGSDNLGNTITIRANAFTNIPYDEQSQITITQNGVDTTQEVYKWNISQTPQLYGFSTNKYYNGVISFRLNYGNSSSILTQGETTISDIYLGEGLRWFMAARTDTFALIAVVFDNYYMTSSTVGLGTLTYDYFVSRTSYSQNQLYVNFNTYISNISMNISGTDAPALQGVASMISTMVGYAINSASEFDDIVSLLTTIRNQDSTYYASIINNMGTLHNDLSGILNELDLDFSQVQTVLDLFPSYRTLVLQYWQQLLEMNAAQSSAAEEMESQYQNKDNQSGQIIGNLGSVPMPSFSNGDFDILGNTDGTQKANFFGLIALITNNGLVTTILLIVVTGMIVGYVLYGKK